MQPLLAPAPSSMMQGSQVEQANAEHMLRAHLLAQVTRSGAPPQRTHAGLQDLSSGSDLQQHVQNIDPAIGGNTNMMSHSAGESGGDDAESESRKGKRALSTSKRAAQNRAAQRAFRQRKEGHIKRLEEQVRDYNALSEAHKTLQAENYQLRDYIINLQSRLIESQGEFPQPPSNIALQHPRATEQAAPTAPMGSAGIAQMQASQAQNVVAEAQRMAVSSAGQAATSTAA